MCRAPTRLPNSLSHGACGRDWRGRWQPPRTSRPSEPEAERDREVLTVGLLDGAVDVGELGAPQVLPARLHVELRALAEPEGHAAADGEGRIPRRAIANDPIDRHRPGIADHPVRIAPGREADVGSREADCAIADPEAADAIGLRQHLTARLDDAV